VHLEDVKAQVLSLPEVAAWPEMAGIFERVVSQPFVTWEMPLLACQAVGGEPAAAIPGATAIACMQLGLLLVDDMLDEDPRGVYLQLGQAATANLAFAFQAAAFRVIEQAPVDAERRTAVYASLAQMALTTAFGQKLDAQNLQGEENYWTTVRAKTAPCFGVALQVGALLGQASPEIADRLRDFGLLFGEVIQIYDDLKDALQAPAGPDWIQGRNNLAILYAVTAEHPERARFEALLPQVDDPQVLETARQILIRCGAGSYCAYQVIQRHQVARQLLDSTPLADPTPLVDLLARQRKPLVTLLEKAGAEVPAELGVA
jgi:geranylgeranyl diphosphate synthase type I